MTMTNLLDASRNLMTRPNDEHFASFSALRSAAQIDERNARAAKMPVNALELVPSVDGELLVRRRHVGAAGVPMTYTAARQLLRYAGAQPEFIFNRLSPETAAKAVTEALSKCDEEVQTLIGTVTGADGKTTGPKLRAVTGANYCRTWDADVAEEIDRWVLGAGFVPALPTKNTDAQRNNVMGNNKPCLFRGDGTSFQFFMHETDDDGAGGRPVRRGVFLRNSEVGLASLGATSFVFDDLCANFIVWGATARKKLRIVHRGSDSGHLLRKLSRELQTLSPTLSDAELTVMAKAAKTPFAKDIDTAAERLNMQFGVALRTAKDALAASEWAENRQLTKLTHAWVANGITSIAKQTTHADTLVELATIGGDIYMAGAV